MASDGCQWCRGKRRKSQVPWSQGPPLPWQRPGSAYTPGAQHLPGTDQKFDHVLWLTATADNVGNASVPRLTEANLTQLLAKPYGKAVLECIKARHWNLLQQMASATEDLTSHCMICGIFLSRPQEMNMQYRTQHGSLVPHAQTKASQLCRSLTVPFL